MRTGSNRLQGDGWLCLQEETGMKGGILPMAGSRKRTVTEDCRWGAKTAPLV
jgi:hypothetical protein